MSGSYPTSELAKVLPSAWMEGWTGEMKESESGEGLLVVSLGRSNDLLPSGRVRPLVELRIEDKETPSNALDYVDEQMQENPMVQQIAAQMASMGFPKAERNTMEDGGRKYFAICEPDYGDVAHAKKSQRFILTQGRLMIEIKGDSSVLTFDTAKQIVNMLDLSVELRIPQEEPPAVSTQAGAGGPAATPFASVAAEAAAIQKETEELERLYQEKQVPEEEYQRRKSELQLRAMGISTAMLGVSSYLTMAGVGAQGLGIPTTPQPLSQQRLCPSCGKDVGNAKFCPNCGAKVQRLCPSCGKDAGSAKFCPDCGTMMPV